MTREVTAITAITKELIWHLRQSHFMIKCENQTIKYHELQSFLAQHAHYSRRFTRYLCAVLSNLEDQEDFNQIFDNLCDEMGLKQDLTIPHSLLYREMIKKMGVDTTVSTTLETKQLIDAMQGYCRHPDPLYGVSAICLGAEAIVPELYFHIVNAFKAHKVKDNDLIFFTVHIHCDDDHAAALRRILEKILAQNPDSIIVVRQVAQDMIKHRIRFLDALLD